jgi:hypothetical protein
MWIRSLRWRDKNPGAKPIRGSFMPGPDSEDLDTSGLDAPGLRELLPASGAALAEHGQLILELVVEGSDKIEELRPLLEICAPTGGDSLAKYTMLADPIPSLSEFQVGPGGVDVGISLRALETMELAMKDRIPRDPDLVIRPVRVFDNETVLIVVWRDAQATPSVPAPRSGQSYYLPTREFPGVILPSTEVEEEIARGVPEKQARFTTEWGGSGPRRLDEALREFDDSSSRSPQQVAERWMASILGDIEEVAKSGLTLVLRQWEVDLQAVLADEEEIGRDLLRPLARLGAIADRLEGAFEDASEPFDHAKRYLFAKSEDSERIDRALTEIEVALKRLGVRLRDSIGLASAVSSASALRIQQENRRAAEGLERAVTTISSMVLGPGLVFGLYGANVPLPLGGTWPGFALMVLLALVSAAAIRFLLGRFSASRPEQT